MSNNTTTMLNVVIENKVEQAQGYLRFYVFRMFFSDFCLCSGCPFYTMEWFKNYLKKENPFNMNLVISTELEHPVNRVASLILRVVEQAYDDIEEIERIVNIENVSGVRIIKQTVPWTNCQKRMQERCLSTLSEESAKHLENITGMHITQNHPETYVISDEELI